MSKERSRPGMIDRRAPIVSRVRSRAGAANRPSASSINWRTARKLFGVSRLRNQGSGRHGFLGIYTRSADCPRSQLSRGLYSFRKMSIIIGSIFAILATTEGLCQVAVLAADLDAPVPGRQLREAGHGRVHSPIRVRYVCTERSKRVQTCAISASLECTRSCFILLR